MLTTSSEESKDSIVAKLVKETDIPRDALCGWRRQDDLA
jgi:hypothetical protein